MNYFPITYSCLRWKAYGISFVTAYVEHFGFELEFGLRFSVFALAPRTHRTGQGLIQCIYNGNNPF